MLDGVATTEGSVECFSMADVKKQNDSKGKIVIPIEAVNTIMDFNSGRILCGRSRLLQTLDIDIDNF